MLYVEVLFCQERKLFLMQVSDHPGLLDTSELLRPEAILKEKVIFYEYFRIFGKHLIERDNQKHLKISTGLKHLSGSVPGLHEERCPWRKS